ncbi:MAG: hypothetical protein JWM11_1357 [Planctomycetaceae bacterium]|nr:hypothetical protein [Planctomycetaceae bacterium]
MIHQECGLRWVHSPIYHMRSFVRHEVVAACGMWQARQTASNKPNRSSRAHCLVPKFRPRMSVSGIRDFFLKTIFPLVSSTVSKIQLFLLSLIGAGPAGFLTYLLCMYLIDQPTGANTMVMVFAILTVLCTAPLTLMPVLILVMYYSNYDPPKIPKPGKAKAEEGDEDDDAETVEAVEEEDSGKGKAGKSKAGKKPADEDEELFDDADVTETFEDDEDK